MEKKEKKIKWYQIILVIIVSICIYFSMLLCVYSLLNIKKSNAYTNNVIPYENEQITDLKNTNWEFNETIINALSNKEINFKSNEMMFNSIECYRMQIPTGISYLLNYNGENNITAYNAGAWQGNYKTIEITDGADTTDTTLISWLNENATFQGYSITEEFYNITYNLQNVIVIGEKPTEISNLEEIEIEIQNFNNYELPQNIMVENASYNWNYQTGILTIYDAIGNVSITIRAEYISGNYSFIELIDSVVLTPLNTFFNLFNYELFGVNIYALLTATLTLFVIIKILLKVFK